MVTCGYGKRECGQNKHPYTPHSSECIPFKPFLVLLTLLSFEPDSRSVLQVRELENELSDEGRRFAETEKTMRKQDRRLKEMMFQVCAQSHRSHTDMRTTTLTHVCAHTTHSVRRVGVISLCL